MRKWLKIGVGIGSSIITILGLFQILAVIYGFQIVNLTGDITCEGDYFNPCISDLSVRNPNAYYVDIYSKEEVKLDFSPEIKDYALFVKDGRCKTNSISCASPNGLWFEGWKYIDFTNKTKPREDKEYVFRFPAYTTKYFRIVGIKNNPKETIKWSFSTQDKELDPYWYGSGSGITIPITYSNPENLNYKVEIDNGLKISYKDTYSVTFIPYFVMKNGAVYQWGDIPASIEKDLWKVQIDDTHYKYGVNFNNISTTIKNNLQYVVLHRSNSTGLTWDDIRLEGNTIIIKDKIYISHDDILSTYTIPIINKTDIVIGNLISNFISNGDGTWNISFDPTIVIQNSAMYAGTLINVTAEANFTHLNITTTTPYNNLIGYWNFDGDKRDGSTSPRFVSGKVGNSLSFDGNDIVELGDPNIGSGRNNITICAWINVPGNTVSSSQMIIAQSGAGYDPFKLGIDSAEDITFSVDNVTHVSAISTCVDCVLNKANQWIHVCGVYNTTNVFMYINGTRQGTTVNLTANIDDNSQAATTLGIGGTTFAGSMNGSIDEVMVFHRILSSTEILDLYNNQSAGLAGSDFVSDAFLVAYYPFNLSSNYKTKDYGTGANDGFMSGFDDLGNYDFSSNNLDGTFLGTTIVNSSGCVYGDCVQFSGDGTYGHRSYIDYPNKWTFGNSSMTISLWANPKTGQASISDYRMLQSTTTASECVLRGNNNRAEFILNSFTTNDRVNSPINTFPANTWTHVVGMYNNVTMNMSIWINGVIVNSTIPTGNYSICSSWAIGGYSAVSMGYFNGSIDEVMVFNTNLTSAQVLAIYNNQSARFAVSGTQDINSINISGTGTENKVNITLGDCDTNLGSNLSAQLGIYMGAGCMDDPGFYVEPDYYICTDISDQTACSEQSNCGWDGTCTTVFYPECGSFQSQATCEGLSQANVCTWQYQYNGSVVNFQNCMITNYTITGNPNNVSLRLKFYAGNSTNPFYSPIIKENVTLTSWYEAPVGGVADINYSVALPLGLIRFLGCSPDFENKDSRPDGQTSVIASINATNNGSAIGNFIINLTGTLNSGWTIWASNDSLSNNITLSTTAQTIWSNVAVSETKKIWLKANCSYITANPGQSISMGVQ